MICKNCGTENEEGNVFCINCGSRVGETPESIEPLEQVMSQADASADKPESDAPAPVPFVSSDAVYQQPQAQYTPPPSPAPATPPVQPVYTPPPMYQQPAPPPPPPLPFTPEAPKGLPDTCKILRMPSAPDMPGLSFFDGTTGQYFLYMLLFGFLNCLVVAMPVILLFVFGGVAVDKLGSGFDYELTPDFAGMGTGYIILFIVVATLALIVSLILMSWMYTVLLRWMSHHTIINDHRLVFVGRPAELLKKIVIYWLLTMITAGIFGIWVPVKLLKWKAANTRFAT